MGHAEQLLIPIQFAERRRQGKTKYTFWLFKCKCGNEKVINLRSYKTGQTKSCGCLQKQNHYRLPEGESCFNKLYYSYTIQAKRKNLPFELSKELFRQLTKGTCYYCGLLPFVNYPIQKGLSSNGTYIYNGIDRLNSVEGYIKTNVVTCCKHCNIAKRCMTEQQFVTWVRRVYEHTKSRSY